MENRNPCALPARMESGRIWQYLVKLQIHAYEIQQIHSLTYMPKKLPHRSIGIHVWGLNKQNMVMEYLYQLESINSMYIQHNGQLFKSFNSYVYNTNENYSIMLYVNQRPMYRFFKNTHFIRISKLYAQHIRAGPCKGGMKWKNTGEGPWTNPWWLCAMTDPILHLKSKKTANTKKMYMLKISKETKKLQDVKFYCNWFFCLRL